MEVPGVKRTPVKMQKIDLPFSITLPRQKITFLGTAFEKRVGGKTGAQCKNERADEHEHVKPDCI